MKVIDSSSIAKLVNREPGWEKVEGALAVGCVSMELAVKEVGNSLWKRVVRGELAADKAQGFFAEFVSDRPFAVADQGPLYDQAFQIAASQRLTLYDALFLALSKATDNSLVTSDSAQAEAARRLGISVELIS